MKIIIFIIIFAGYLSTLTPTIGLHDAGDMIASSYTLGIPHPPGYPLYCLVGKLFSYFLSCGNIAYRYNIFSSLSACAACVILYSLIFSLSRSKLISSLVAILLGFSGKLWEQAIIAEKYTLNLLFFSLLLLLLIKIKVHSLKLFLFVLGISLTHHFQTIYILPAFLIALLFLFKKEQTSAIIYALLKGSILFSIPILLYIYLPCRAAQEPPLNWTNPSSVNSFLVHVSAREYTPYAQVEFVELIKKIPQHMRFFYKQFNLLLIFLPLGIIYLFKTNRKNLYIFLVTIIFSIYISLRYNIPNIDDYYLPNFFITGILIGCGISFFKRKIEKFFVTIFSIIIFANLFIKNYNTYKDKRNFYIGYEHGISLIEPLKEDSLLLVKGDDNVFPIWYLLHIERRRQDIGMIHGAYLDRDWYAEQVRKIKLNNFKFSFEPFKEKVLTDFIRKKLRKERIKTILENNIENIPIYAFYDEPEHFQKYNLIRIGLPQLITTKSLSKDEIFKELERAKLGIRIRNIKYLKQKNISQRVEVLVKDYSIGYANRGSHYMLLNEYTKAIEEYKNSLKIDEDYLLANRYIGLAYFYLGKNEEAIKYFKKTLKLSPNDMQIKTLLTELASSFVQNEEKRKCFCHSERSRRIPSF